MEASKLQSKLAKQREEIARLTEENRRLKTEKAVLLRDLNKLRGKLDEAQLFDGYGHAYAGDARGLHDDT